MNRRGFTLIEVILAMVLILGLVAALLTFYWHVLGVRQSTIDYAKAVAARRAVMHQLTDELESAINEPGMGQVLEGKADSIRFVTTDVPGPGVWLPDTQTAGQQKTEASDVHILDYALAASQDDSGDTVVDGLDRSDQALLGATNVKQDSTSSKTLVSSQIKFIQFSYYDGSDWQSSWHANELPAGVEVTLGSDPLPANTDPTDYPYPVARRVIAVLGGIRPPSGSSSSVIGVGP